MVAEIAVPAMGAVMSAVGAGALNFAGAQGANRMSRKIAREQMDFQERMSNTAYQRAVLDMQQAGINPILAANMGGASTPGGAMGQVQNELSGAATSAMDAIRLHQELKGLKLQNEKTQAESDFIRSNTTLAQIQAMLEKNKIPGSEAEKAIDESFWGPLGRALKRLNPFSSAKSVVDVLNKRK